MSISIGDRIPDVKVATPGEEGMPSPTQTGELLGRGHAVLFAVPGAFTPGCSNYHLPGFVTLADQIKEKGIDTIACISVNDAFVMHAWGQDQRVGDSVLMIADGNGDFAKAAGLDLDGTAMGLGLRSRRYAAVLRDGVVEQLFVESGPGVDVSGADNVLKNL